MRTRTLALALFALTAAVVAVLPAAERPPGPGAAPGPDVSPPPGQRPRIEVVFVLDTTGSMGGLIAAAKEKIWSIASTMAAANEAPEIRMGLVGYRDRGDRYVTRVVDLSADLDRMYAALMDFRAAGGGDGPESVNQALHDAVHRISWSAGPGTYRAIFLVGDAPPHLDYANDVPYPDTLAAARERGIVVNAIQCGRLEATRRVWRRVARLGQGRYFQVGQGGDAVAIATPYDERLAELSRRLDGTRLYYGGEAEREEKRAKQAAAERLHEEASVASRARRAAFNATESGKANRIGDHELVEDVAAGRVELEALPASALPEPLRDLAPAEQRALVARKAKERGALEDEIEALARRRAEFLEKKVARSAAPDASLDHKLYEAVREQGARAGLRYEAGGPRY